MSLDIILAAGEKAKTRAFWRTVTDETLSVHGHSLRLAMTEAGYSVATIAAILKSKKAEREKRYVVKNKEHIRALKGRWYKKHIPFQTALLRALKKNSRFSGFWTCQARNTL